jgi:hypothetical protein
MSKRNSIHRCIVTARVASLALAMLVTGCPAPTQNGDQQNPAHPQKPAKPPRLDDQTFVNEINSIIDVVAKPLSDTEIAENFLLFGNSNLQDAKIVLFGEEHNSAAGLTLNTRLLNQLATPPGGKILLLEGGNARSAQVAFVKIIQIFVAKQWEAHGLTYNVKSFSGEVFETQTRALGLASKINLSRIHLGLLESGRTNGAKLDCFGWDREVPQSGDKGMDDWLRNQSMVETIKDSSLRWPKVFVVAGTSHLPEGEFRDYQFRPITIDSELLFSKYLKPFSDIDSYLSFFGKRFVDPDGFRSDLKGKIRNAIPIVIPTFASGKSPAELETATNNILEYQYKAIITKVPAGSTAGIHAFLKTQRYAAVVPKVNWNESAWVAQKRPIPNQSDGLGQSADTDSL